MTPPYQSNRHAKWKLIELVFNPDWKDFLYCFDVYQYFIYFSFCFRVIVYAEF